MNNRIYKTRSNTVSKCREEVQACNGSRELTAREAKNAYNRQWAKANPEKVRASQQKYWERVARELSESQDEEGADDYG